MNLCKISSIIAHKYIYAFGCPAAQKVGRMLDLLNSLDMNTKSGPADDILAWAAGLKPWQQDALRRLAIKGSLDAILAHHERAAIERALDQNRYNLTRTADQLEISRHALRYRMQRLQIQIGPDTESQPKDGTTRK